MNCGYTYGKTLELVHGENQRPVHHAVDHETMLAGIDVGNKRAAMCRRVEERRRRDNPDRILKRSQDVKREPEFIRRMPLGHGLAYRGDETRALAIGDQLVDFLGGLPCVWPFASRAPPAARPASAAPSFRNPLRLGFFELHGPLLEDEVSGI